MVDWMVSLHGGHSVEYCDHAVGSLADNLDQAVQMGFSIYGVTEHAPRTEDRYLYPTEVAHRWSVPVLAEKFSAYAAELKELVDEFAEELVVLRGFETEAVPEDGYVELMHGYREKYGFDYIVGSVHHVGDRLVDGSMKEFELAVQEQDGVERLAVCYYDRVAEIVEALQPEVVGHLDLVRKNAARVGKINTPAVEAAAERALDAIAAHGAIVDVNVAPLRSGWHIPHPAPWLLERIVAKEIGVCLGDDSHAIFEVGEGMEEGRAYLAKHGVKEIAVLNRRDGAIVRETRAL